MILPPSLHDAFLRACDRFPGRLAAIDDRASLTYEQLGSAVGSLAQSLQDGSLQPGERALVALPNSVDFVVAHFAVLAAGGVSAPCDPMMPAARMADIVERSEARVVITTTEIAERLSEIQFNTRPLVLAGDQLRARIDSGLADSLVPSDRAGSDTAVILFTTGSTGAPKGVVLSHRATLFTIGNLISALGYSPDDRELLTLPLSHSFGLGHLYCNLFSGGAVRLERGMLSLKRVLAGLASLPASGFPSTPAGVGLLIDRAEDLFAKAAAGLRFMVINSAPLPPERASQLQALLPNTELFVYYGLTEASRSTLLSLTKGGPSLYRSVGRPMPGVELTLAPEDNEIRIRGPHLSGRYWKDDVLTRQAYADGWLRTGDIGRLDPDGNLFVVGRLKDQINVGGNKVEPGEVEAAVLASGLVADAGVCGIAGAGQEEAVACGLVADPGNPIDISALTAFCAERLEGYKIPTRWALLSAVPRAETGKILRADLVRSVRAVLAQEISGDRTNP